MYQKFHIRSLNLSPNVVRVIKSRRFRWSRHVVRIRQNKNTFNILTGKSTRKIPLVISRPRLGNNIRTELKESDVNTRN